MNSSDNPTTCMLGEQTNTPYDNINEANQTVSVQKVATLMP